MGILLNNLISSFPEVFILFQNSIINRKKLLLTYFNQHCFNIYSTDKNYQELLNNFFKVYPDGIGLYLALNYLFNKKYTNFNATDLNEKIIYYLLDNGITFFIIGGNFDKVKLLEKFKNYECFLGYFPGYFDEKKYLDIVNEINHRNPQVIIIGMGVPKQEALAYKLSTATKSNVYLCVGNFLEFYLGTVKRIPAQYRNKGIEWLYRIKQDPKRLWKRYFIGIPLFIFRVIKFKYLNPKIG